jgi:hypothetical protein
LLFELRSTSRGLFWWFVFEGWTSEYMMEWDTESEVT